MFFEIMECDATSYADENTPYCSSFRLDTLINKLELTTDSLFHWLINSYMKVECYY